MKVLVTGASGQLGQDVCRRLSERGADVLRPTSGEMDITVLPAVRRVFEQFGPDIVIHCAAYNRVDEAETAAKTCRDVNVSGTENIARLSREHDAYLISISSDYVFDGTKDGEYETDDAKNPLSVYGASKSDGEELVLGASEKNAVVRTSWLFGPSDRNFVRAILRGGRAKPRLDVVCDQVGSPTYTEDLAKLLVRMAEERVPGLLHGTNEGFCSRAQFAAAILAGAGLPSEIREVTSEEFPSPALRPKNSRLSKACLDSAGLGRLPFWQDALTRYLARGNDR